MISESVQSALLSRRDLCNSLFLAYRASRPSLDEEQFKRLLFALLPVLTNTPIERQAALADLCEEVYRAALDLSAAGFMAVEGRHPQLLSALVRILESAPAFAFDNLGKFIRRIFAALKQLSEAGVGLEEWERLMKALAAESRDEDEYASKGFVSAWVCGMAHFRPRALDLCQNFSDGSLQTLLGVSPELGRNLLSAMRDNPWCKPGESGAAMADNGQKLRFRKTGGFAGFGGSFAGEPELLTAQEGMYVTDGKTTFRIYADAFGVKLIRGTPGTLAADQTGTGDEFSVSSKTLRWQGRKAEIPELTYLKQFTQHGPTFYFTISNSFYVFLGGVG